VRAVAGIVIIAALLFIPAGTFAYWEAWVWLAILFGGLLFVGTYFFVRDPEVMERRMRTRETQRPQKNIIAAFVVVMIFLFVIPPLDQRFGWSNVPPAVVVLADLLVLFGFALYFVTTLENRYASRVIEVQEGQKVISSGPYAVIRHPMYLAMALLLGFSPLALGSWWGCLPSLLIPFLLAQRITREEDLLRGSLPGYAEYLQKVRFRLVPYIW
jgi:protein-S-isoprenylcysteine O-methyltransferase Ste14